jgi:hypothetical protein
MAIIKTKENHDDMELTINNGDLRALNQIKDKWGFKDNESILRFAIAALTLTDDGYLYAEQKDGTRRILKPAEELLEAASKHHVA